MSLLLALHVHASKQRRGCYVVSYKEYLKDKYYSRQDSYQLFEIFQCESYSKIMQNCPNVMEHDVDND